MKIGILLPYARLGNSPPTAVRVTVEGTFLGLVDSPGVGGSMWAEQANGQYRPEGECNLALAFRVPSRCHWGAEGRPLRAERSAQDVYYFNPCCIAFEGDTGTLIWDPREQLGELGPEHKAWLANYPEWAGHELRDPRWKMAVLHNVSARAMGLVSRAWSKTEQELRPKKKGRTR